MKKVVLFLFSISILAACGGKSKTAKEIAEEICDCSSKSNGLPATDPTREQAQKDCTEKALKAWNQVKDDQKKADEYNKIIGACAEQQIKKSFGQ
jgi:chorismate mutase